MATFEETIEKAVQAAVKRALLDAHPVGSIYLTIKDENPSAKFGGTWVKLPSSVCLQTADTTHGAGTTIAAGLPNITGQVRVYSDYNKGNTTYANELRGAFYWDKSMETPSNEFGTSANVTGGNADAVRNVPFDASRSSAIYGKSTTVQPPAYALIAWRRTA